MTDQTYDIHKAAGLIIHDRKVLATRTRGKDIFIHPGGKLEPGETEEQALIRELNEELNIDVSEQDLEKIGTYYSEAAGRPGVQLKLTAFVVKSYRGTLTPQSEVEETRWINSQPPKDIKIASIFEHDVLPALKARNLID